MEHNLLSPADERRRQELLAFANQKGLFFGKRGFTLEEAREYVALMVKDTHIDKLVARHQQDPSSLSIAEKQMVATVINLIAKDEPDVALRLLNTPMDYGKIEDGRISAAFTKALHQVGYADSAMDVKLAKAAEPALLLMNGPVGGALRGVGVVVGSYRIGQGGSAIADRQLVSGVVQVIDGALTVIPAVAVTVGKSGTAIPNSYVPPRIVPSVVDKPVTMARSVDQLVMDGVIDMRTASIIKQAEHISTAKVHQSTVPRDLGEQLLWSQVIKSPSKGVTLPDLNRDRRFSKDAGFEKKYVVHSLPDNKHIEIHYQYNRYTDRAYDIKVTTEQPSKLQPGATLKLNSDVGNRYEN